jgi:hypothetical protein
LTIVSLKKQFFDMEIHKKIVVNEQGTPQEVIIPWEEFQKIQYLLGLEEDISISPEWESEIASRIDDIDSGRADLVSGEAVFDRLRSVLSKN